MILKQKPYNPIFLQNQLVWFFYVFFYILILKTYQKAMYFYYSKIIDSFLK